MSTSKITRRNFIWTSLALPAVSIVDSQMETVKKSLPMSPNFETKKIGLSELADVNRVALFGLPGEGLNELGERILGQSRNGFDDQNIGTSAQSESFWQRLNDEVATLGSAQKTVFTFQDVYDAESLDRIIDTLQAKGFTLVRVVPQNFESAIGKVATQYSISGSKQELSDCYATIFYRLLERTEAPYLEWAV